MRRLEGKVAVITGANSGIGLASAKRFAREGAQLFVTGRRQAELDAAVSEIGGDTVGVRGDISNFTDLDRLYETVREKAGVIDILFANAGIGEFATLQDITEEHFDRTFAVNVKGTLFTVKKALPLLRDGVVYHSHRLVGGQWRFPRFQRLQRKQGGNPQFCAWLDCGPSAAAYQGKCAGSRRDIYTRLARIGAN